MPLRLRIGFQVRARAVDKEGGHWESEGRGCKPGEVEGSVFEGFSVMSLTVMAAFSVRALSRFRYDPIFSAKRPRLGCSTLVRFVARTCTRESRSLCIMTD